MARVLIIDDDASLLDVLALAFEDAGHEVSTAKDGASGWAKIQSEQPALLVSDVNLPELDGFTITRRLREGGSALPIILLTSRDSEIDEALGLELGADDYVTKPFSTRVLLARVSALLRREALRGGASESPTSTVLERDGLRLDPERLEARFRSKLLSVTLTEFRLAEALLKRPGMVQTRERLLDQIRGDDSVVAARIIDTYVRRLRRKLEEIDPKFDRIETVVGVGYRWADDGS
jgi:DNA-binding response OmpR family regulator